MNELPKEQSAAGIELETTPCALIRCKRKIIIYSLPGLAGTD